MAPKIGGTIVYTNKNNPTETKRTITTDRNIVITNYNPASGALEKQQNNSIEIKAFDGNTSIRQKYSNKTSNNLKSADWGSTRYSVFNALCELDGNTSDLTVADLSKAKNLVGKFNVKNVKMDLKALIVNIIFNDGSVLRFDAENDEETKARQNNTQA